MCQVDQPLPSTFGGGLMARSWASSARNLQDSTLYLDDHRRRSAQFPHLKPSFLQLHSTPRPPKKSVSIVGISHINDQMKRETISEKVDYPKAF